MRFHGTASPRTGYGAAGLACLSVSIALASGACTDVTKAVAFERRLNIVAVASLAADPAHGVAAQPGGTLGDLHVRVTQADAAPYDTIVPYPSGASEAAITIRAPVLSSSRELGIAFELRVSGQPHYSGSLTIPLEAGSSPAPQQVTLAYVGPVASLAFTTDTIRLSELDTLPLPLVLRDVAGNPISGRSVTYTYSAPNVAAVSPSGAIAGLRAGVTTITAMSEGKSASSTVLVSGLFTTIHAGGGTTCGLTTGGVAYCWGAFVGDGVSPFSRRPVRVAGNLDFVSVKGGQFHQCGVTEAGVGVCWGLGGVGQLGDGTLADHQVPTPVAGGRTWTEIVPGSDHTCGITNDGATWCWGGNDYGQLGDGTTTLGPAPVAVGGAVAFASLATGGFHSCGLTAAGAAYCWGQNFVGQLGDGTTAHQPFPTPVAGGISFAQLVSGIANQVTCGLNLTGTAFCWGWNQLGQLGNGTGSDQSVPTQVAGGNTFAGIALGQAHACAWNQDAAYCWGRNDNGELGNGTTVGSATPVAVAGGITFQEVTLGDSHTCGRDLRGAVFCWGNNAIGQIGDGTATSRSVPTRVLLPMN